MALHLLANDEAHDKPFFDGIMFAGVIERTDINKFNQGKSHT